MMVRYPWKDWLAPKRYTRPQSLVRGEDYFVQHYIMANMLRNRATKDGLKVSISIGLGGLTFTITPRRVSRTKKGR